MPRLDEHIGVAVLMDCSGCAIDRRPHHLETVLCPKLFQIVDEFGRRKQLDLLPSGIELQGVRNSYPFLEPFPELRMVFCVHSGCRFAYTLIPPVPCLEQI